MDPVVQHEISDEDQALWDRDGYIFLPGLLLASYANKMRDDIDEVLDITKESGTTLQFDLRYLYGTAIEAYVNSSNLRTIAGELMKAPTSFFCSSLLVKGVECEETPFHQDDLFFQAKNGQTLNIWVALNDINAENGGLMLCPGSHKAGKLDLAWRTGNYVPDNRILLELDRPEPIISPNFKTGDAVVLSNYIVHGSNANRTAQNRYSYSTAFISDGTLVRWDNDEWVDPLANPNSNAGPRHRTSFSAPRQTLEN